MKVLVVGAGPAGVATALLLARHGVEMLLVEREATPDRVFRGEGLQPLGVDALARAVPPRSRTTPLLQWAGLSGRPRPLERSRAGGPPRSFKA